RISGHGKAEAPQIETPATHAVSRNPSLMELLPDRDSLCFRESKKIQVCLFKKTDEKSSLQNELLTT
ncbi:MAG: hypothetical protein IJK21_05985, partial [Prevotella sp.]|nr:hypothetical protein [Prevotella sp.]